MRRTKIYSCPVKGSGPLALFNRRKLSLLSVLLAGALACGSSSSSLPGSTTTVAVSGVSLDQSALSLAAGVATGTLTVMVSPANATNKNVSWSISDATVAMVTNGVVTPVGAGVATITVTTLDGAKTATCAVSVAAAPGPQLIAIGSLDGATDLSGLTGTLENGDPENVLGSLGSGMAWAGGNTFLNVPDRGPNAVAYDASIDDTTAYIGRFHTVQMALTPNPGPGLRYLLTPTLTKTTLLSSTDSLHYGTGSSQSLMDVLDLNATNGVNYFTGRSDGYGSGDSGNPLNSRLDPEAIRVSNDGESIFISDEYGPDVYQFDRATGRRIRSFALPSGFYVANESPVGADEISGNTSGRVSNKGMEGLAITPDGATLVGFMQSALIQDGGNKAKVDRIVTIDIASGVTHQYAYNNRIGGASYNISEIVAINNHEFLVDERDGNGLGGGSGATVKQLYKIDLAGAADVSAIAGEDTLLTYAVDKTLFLDIRAVLNAAGIADTEIPSKIEGVAFGSDMVINGIIKHTLWVANDNDFVPADAGTNKFFVFAVSDADLGESVFVSQALTPRPAISVAVTGVIVNQP